MGKEFESGPVQMPDDDIGMYLRNEECQAYRQMVKAMAAVSQDPVHIKWLKAMTAFFAQPGMIEEGEQPEDTIRFIKLDHNR